ncbi:MAG TPA: alpha-glucan family phosphorylase [Acidimicrobiia bacterium]|nr:alpha-glucan family phosphorylase [Acidimicrobiia bacterium]
MLGAGLHDLDRAVTDLAHELPDPLRPLAAVAYDYRWSWVPGGADVFAGIDAHRFGRDGNPVRLLRSSPRPVLERAAADRQLVERAAWLAEVLAADRARPWDTAVDPRRPVAFVCAEFGVHRSLPVYSGGLGVLAGDILKAASDRALPMVAVGLLYRRGYFHQRIDTGGRQHEYWIDLDPRDLPAALVTGADGRPIVVRVPAWDGELAAQVWRVAVGRVPLFLLDADLPENSELERWVTSRLYEGNRSVRLAQYSLLGIGGVLALDALGIDPAVVHLNEGHAALAALELASRSDRDDARDEPLARVRERFVFTTHTPVAAGNETYGADELLATLGGVPARVGLDPDRFLDLCRITPGTDEPVGMTPLAIRASRSVNGVSARHGDVARSMWQPMFPDRDASSVPITSVTNGVHVPTWMAPRMRALLDEHLGAGWETRAADPDTWSAIDAIPDSDLWAVRCELRAELVEHCRSRAVTDRLARGEQLEYVRAAWTTFDPGVLTVGFARRIATYKRLHLLSVDPQRALALLDGDRPLQFLFAGKAHPMDESAKQVTQQLFGLKDAPGVAGRVAFLEDYDLSYAARLVAGCDVWLNVPRPPMEASGTSGMKAALNGALNVSVLDGWWAEAHDGTNGWAIDGEPDDDWAAQDHRHATALYDVIEHDVVPMFHDRDAAGIPRAWVARMKASLRTIGWRFSADRMVADYVRDVYRHP